MPTPAGVTAPEAGLGRRLAAVVYEALVVAAIVLVAGFALAPFVSPAANPSGPLVVPAGQGRLAGLVGLVAVLGTYFAWSWSAGRRTLPMKTWRLTLVGPNGEPVSAARALARCAAAGLGPVAAIALVGETHSRLGWLALAVPWAWAFVDPARRFLHDRIAGTRLVRHD